MATKRTAGTKAVVTGAGSGIGRAFALELAARGGRVVCSDIALDRAEATAAEIRASGGTAHAVACDVGRLEDVEALAGAAEDFLGAPVDLVVNNAGVGTGGSVIGETPIEDWRWTVGINLWGVIHGCHVFVPRLRAAGRGGVINVASAAGFAAAPQMAAYNATKAAVIAVSETLAAELSGTGIGVTVVCPTFVATNIAVNGRMTDRGRETANQLMARGKVSAEGVARMALDGHDRGRLYVLPQLDAKIVWRAKRSAPNLYLRAVSLGARLAERRLSKSEPAAG
ncbi:SDR family NAD(P)-dependent oxidoreductase [Acidiferrimicrobium sp. IK]|uniref:SDR family NAD(P)-dependent oxidoreductase n=1 Tax=Acidiferrimicrobium sp. IK TaxID=2871700 RepID=UPI0021CB5A06|nr:SDR family NAD(P)-dependent oxidoreductase [Acidiferrimicrobium sp. IK]MCU4186068.1 SDR family NAD(P)-dependent oxidoreductase [Acidiferrimicrobium sp. IK]